MRIPVIDWLGIGNVGTVANAGREVARRSLEDAVLAGLVAALARHDGTDPAVDPPAATAA